MRILLVDDHTLFREALFHVLNQLGPEIIVLEAANAQEASQLISRSPNLDLVLLDIDLPLMDGLTALPGLRELAPTVPIVVLSGSEATEHVKRAIENGAVGYIPKSSSGHEMLVALRMVMQGDVFIPPRLLGKLGTTPSMEDCSQDKSTPPPLTVRQLEVLELMARGLPNKSIAKTLAVAEGTVKLHVAAILRALASRNRTQAVTKATRLGWVSTNDQKL